MEEKSGYFESKVSGQVLLVVSVFWSAVCKITIKLPYLCFLQPNIISLLFSLLGSLKAMLLPIVCHSSGVGGAKRREGSVYVRKGTLWTGDLIMAQCENATAPLK